MSAAIFSPSSYGPRSLSRRAHHPPFAPANNCPAHVRTLGGALAPPLGAVPVPGIGPEIRVKVASTEAEWADAFRLVRENYIESGYEQPSDKPFRFTPYHALPDTAVFVAKLHQRVVATFTLVPDNTVLGLPLDGLYGEEVQSLRAEGRRIAEVTGLAARDLSPGEFNQVFVTLIRVMKQYHLHHGGDTWVIRIQPRHRVFYTKAVGYVPLGPCRSHPSVAGHLAEAYWVDAGVIRSNAPRMADVLFADPLPEAALAGRRMPADLIRSLAAASSQCNVWDFESVLHHVDHFGSPRRW